MRSNKWMAMTVAMAVVLGAIALALTGPQTSYGQSTQTCTVRLSSQVGRSVGIFSQRPAGWGADASSAVLVFGNYMGPVTGQTHHARAYLHFPVSLPAGATVQGATLQVHAFDWPFGGAADIGAYQVLADWDEDMAWAGRPAANDVPVSTAPLASAAGPAWAQWDLTALAREWARSPAANHGVMLAGAPVPDALAGNGWAAAGHGRMGAVPDLAPLLTIHYTAGPVEIPEPATWLLLAGGLAGLAGWLGWRRRGGGQR